MPVLERKWWTLIAVCTAIFMLLLDITVVNVALPDIQRSLHSSFSDLQWVVDAYSLTLAAFLLTAGVVGDMFGRREVFAIGLGVFSLSSLVCGLSTSSLMLNLARAVQGVGGAIMFATSLALIAAAFQGKERGTAFGIYGAVIGGAVAVGTARRRGHHQRHRLAVDLLRQRPDRHRGHRDHPDQGPGVPRPEHATDRLDRVRLLLGVPLHAGLRPGAWERQPAGAARDRRASWSGPALLMVVFLVGEWTPERPDARPVAVPATGHGRHLGRRLHPLGLDLRPVLVPDPLHPRRPRLRTLRRRPPVPAAHPAGLHRGPYRRQADGPFPCPVHAGHRPC